MTIEIFDSVILTEPLPAEGLSAGDRGAVVEVWGDHEAYEVEFMRGEYTIALVTLGPDKVRLVEKHLPTRASITAD